MQTRNRDSKKSFCKIVKQNFIMCEAKLPNEEKISQLYEAPAELIDIVEKDFIENKVKPVLVRQLQMENKFQKVTAYMMEKPIKCQRKFRFKDEGTVRKVEELGICKESEERWKRTLRLLEKIGMFI